MQPTQTDSQAGATEMDELTRVLKEDQKKEDGLEQIIRLMKKRSRENQRDEQTSHSRNKRPIMENISCNYEGSIEGLLLEKNKNIQ